MTVTYMVGDVFDRLAEIPDGSVDLIVTSPPFLALRSYLPADHPDKGKEIGSEPTPAAFLDTMMALTAEWRRVLAPHGSIAVEFGDTYSGAGGAGGDYNAGGALDGPMKYARTHDPSIGPPISRVSGTRGAPGGPGWPLDKSLCLIPTLYPACLAYGRNLLTGSESPAGRWRVRNLVTWLRPNPPVGALGDKWRPASSFITVACTGRSRFFDLDAVRSGEYAHPERIGKPINNGRGDSYDVGVGSAWSNQPGFVVQDRGGAPPLDWHSDLDDGVGHLILTTQPYRGSHYATFPEALPRKLIECMCPTKVCTRCGKPSERITESERTVVYPQRGSSAARSNDPGFGEEGFTARTTLGWTDCGHDAWRPGLVLDPFGGSGTTGVVAQGLGRDCLLIDLDDRNAELARERIGMFLEVSS